MKKIISTLLVLTALFVAPISLEAHQPNIEKVRLGETFNYFELDDTIGQTWISTYLRTRPIIIVTGHRYQKHDISRWVESFAEEYQNTGRASVFWVANLSKFPWSTSRDTVAQQWRTICSSVPILLDWDGIIGRSLKINYNIPNIIVIDSCGRLVMHEMHTYSPQVYRAVSDKIAPICCCPCESTPVYIMGNCGDSN